MKTNEILKYFNDNNIHHFDELYCIVSKEYQSKNITKNALRKIISRLRNKGNIYTVSKNVYAKGNMEIFEPDYDRKMKLLENYIKNNYPEIKFLLWDTNWLNMFSHNYYMKSYKVIEVEKGFEEVIFNHLKEKYPKTLFKPTSKEYDFYLDSSDIIVVKTLLKRSPMNKSKIGNYPKIEKILVDTYIERHAYSWLQGVEWERMLINVIDSCEIDITTLIHYALYRRNENVINSLYSAINYHKSKDNHYYQYLMFSVREGNSYNWRLLNENAKKNLMQNCNKHFNLTKSKMEDQDAD